MLSCPCGQPARCLPALPLQIDRQRATELYLQLLPALCHCARPDPGEALLQEKLTPPVEALAHPDEPCRRAAVEHVLRTCLPAVVGRLIERLVDLLGGEGTTRRQALASLAQLGGRAVPALPLRFPRSRSVALQRGIVEALTRTAPGLKLAKWIDP
jgi:hypothetical protein